MSRKVLVAGVGMIPFTKPGRSEHYYEMGAKAIVNALADAGIGFDKIGQAYAGYVYGDSTSGQRAIYGAGMTGIPVVNVNNNCASGSSALWLARQAVESGVVECALAVGFEQMQPGALVNHWGDRPAPMERTRGSPRPHLRHRPRQPVHGDAVLRCRCAGVLQAVRGLAGSVREDLGQIPQARCQQPVRGFP